MNSNVLQLVLSAVVILAFFAGAYQAIYLDIAAGERRMHTVTALVGLLAFVALVAVQNLF